MSIWAIIPVKPLREGKSRLSAILSPADRARLTRHLLRHTLHLLRTAGTVKTTLVVSRDTRVLKIAGEYDAVRYAEGDRHDLNGALTRAAHIAASRGAESLLILPADLPFLAASDIERLIAPTRPSGDGPGPTVVPRSLAIATDRAQDGTNALLLTPPLGFAFQYGAGSYARHVAEAQRLGLRLHRIDAPGLRFDLDTEEDWAEYVRAMGGLRLFAGAGDGELPLAL